MSEKIKNIVKHLLLAFVFLSIGFSLGKEFARKVSSGENTESSLSMQNAESAKEKKCLFVYYVHSTFRCKTCLTIEKLVKDFLNRQYSEELKSGKIIFKEVNFQKDEEFAKKYKIASGTVLLVKVSDGKDLKMEELNDVWTLYENTTKFDEYLKKSIKNFLE